MRGEDDAPPLQRAWQHTLALYARQFGPVPKELWPSSKRCRGKRPDALFRRRPQLVDLCAG
jgi:hypothetical protein